MLCGQDTLSMAMVEDGETSKLVNIGRWSMTDTLALTLMKRLYSFEKTSLRPQRLQT